MFPSVAVPKSSRDRGLGGRVGVGVVVDELCPNLKHHVLDVHEGVTVVVFFENSMEHTLDRDRTGDRINDRPLEGRLIAVVNYSALKGGDSCFSDSS